MTAPSSEQYQLSPQDLAQFESLGVSSHNQPDTHSGLAASNPNAPANPYNPFLTSSSATTEAPTYSAPESRPADDLAQLAAAPAPTHAAALAHATATPAAPTSEPKTWPTKDVLFQGSDRKIVMQNDNGPCSLIAIANILLLRGDVQLQPPDRPLVNYEYLSSLIADYLLTRPPPPSGTETSLEQALSLLPQTRYGLNLNPSFLSNDAFRISESQSHHLALFELLGIKLYHGFLPDSSSPTTYNLAIEAGSYDAAVDAVVKGDEVAQRFFTEALAEPSVPAPLREIKKRGGLPFFETKLWGTEADRKTIAQALELSAFLDANASQLTYPGLFALTALPEGFLCALFRSNHLSVLYRPKVTDNPPPTAAHAADGATTAGLPSILTLITAEAFLDEELAVWESLADVDGSDSGEIFDGRFRKRRFEHSRSQGRHRTLNGHTGPAGPTAANGSAEDADYALALQIHAEETDRAERHRRRQSRRDQRGRTGTYQGEGSSSSSSYGTASAASAPGTGTDTNGDNPPKKSGLAALWSRIKGQSSARKPHLPRSGNHGAANNAMVGASASMGPATGGGGTGGL